MSRTHDHPHRPSFSFGNPFRMMKPKGNPLPKKLVDFLNEFENNLAERLRNIKPKSSEDILSLPWMISVMELLCGTHNDIKSLITKLELPVCDWDENWIDAYLDSSVKVLDMCIAFSSEISRLNQGHILLQCVLHNLAGTSPKQFMRTGSSLNSWKQHVSSKNPRLENCPLILDTLSKTLDLPKIKNSAKGQILMRAMYGVKVVTLFLCGVFTAAFTGSDEKLKPLNVPDTYLWAQEFIDLQTNLVVEIKNVFTSGKVTVLKEFEAVDSSVKKLTPLIQDGVNGPSGEIEAFQKCVSELRSGAERLSQGLDVLAKRTDAFFQIVLSGRDALLCNLRSAVSDSMYVDGSVVSPRNGNSNKSNLGR